ncbi:MAG TPA: MFS transporter [Terriglobales bacterium]|nr:MFS transporter [Terriglobales bacterium]
MAEQPEQQADTRTLIVLAFAATAGVMVEFYDFSIYGYAAASAFPAIFFPRFSPSQALVFSYLAFGAGFPSRLLGAFIFGHFGDRIGRKYSFLINILIMGVTTCLTGLLPGYATLGIAAPILLVLLRIVQGFGLGGEFGGACSLLAEFGSQRRSRAFWISLANLGIPLGSMAASTVLLVMSKNFATTGWRIAMLLSGIIVIPALLARYKLADTPLFERIKQQERLARMPSFNVFKKHAGPILLLALVLAFQQMDGNVNGTYAISFMRFAGIPLATTATIILLTRIGDIFGILLSGPLADLCKRKRVAYIAIGLATLLSYPCALAILHRRIALVMLFQFLITFFGLGLLHGLAPILTSESLPTKFRYSGTGISYSLAAILGGMVAPSILAGLIGNDVLHKWFYLPIVYFAYCVVAMLALLFIGETRDLSLEELDQEPSLAVEVKAERHSSG